MAERIICKHGNDVPNYVAQKIYESFSGIGRVVTLDNTDNQVYIAVSGKMPKIGEPFKCHKLLEEQTYNSDMMWEFCITTPVVDIEVLANNICKVETCNSTYYVYVILLKGNCYMHIAVSNTLPVIGECFECRRLVENSILNFAPCNLSPVRSIDNIGNNIYMVNTVYKGYIVKVYN